MTKNFLLQFTEQLSLLYQSGIPLSQAFLLLKKSKFLSYEQDLFASIESHIQRGQSLAKSLKRYPEIFPQFYLQLIELGEVSGALGEVLQDLSTTLARQTELKRKIWAALFYPCTVLCINGLVILGLLWFIVPKYAFFFAKNTDRLPIMTQALFILSQELHQFWYLNATLATLTVLGLWYIFHRPSYQQQIHKQISAVYGLKTLIKMRDLALLCRNLALCLNAGLSLTQALKLSGPLSLNPMWHQACKEMIADIHQGKNVSSAFKKHEFPALVLQLIKIGETTGKLEIQFLKIAVIYEEELARLLNKLTQLLEPLMMMVLGLIVGVMMYALYQPLMQLGNLI